MLFYCLLVCIVFEEKAVTLKTFGALFLWMLSRFSFYIWFLAVWCAHVRFLVIFQFCFEFTELLKPEDQDAFLKSWQISSHYSFEYFFCLILSSPPGTPRTHILEFFIFSHRSVSFCSLKNCFLLFFRLDNFYLSIFKVTDSSATSILLLSPSCDLFLTLHIASFTSRIYIDSFLNFLCLCLCSCFL